MDETEKVLKQLAAIHQAEAAHQRRVLRRCEWENPEDVSAYRKDLRRERREELIKRVAPDMRCPQCGRLEINMRSWVVSLCDESALCRSCFMSDVTETHYEEVVINEPLASIQRRYAINSDLLRQYREMRGLSQKDFAALAGWTRSFQYNLETNTYQTVNEEIYLTVIAVLKRLNIIIKKI